VPSLLTPQMPPAHHRKCQTTSAGNRQRPPRGGSHERRTHGSSSRHYLAPRRSIHQDHLCCSRSFRPLVPQVVATLPGGRTRRSLRPDPGQSPGRPTHPTQVGEDDRLHPPPATGPCLAGHPLQPDRGHGYPGRVEGPGHPPAPLRTHHRAGLAAQRLDGTAGPPGPAAATSAVPRTPGAGLQRAARGRSGGADLPQGQRPPLLHLGGQGRLRE
jgi:hypothetical protein